MNTIRYKDYIGSVEFSEEDSLFYGKVMGIRSLITYEGENAEDLVEDFHDAIDHYLETCQAEGRDPETAFEGSFKIRLSPALHKKLVLYAADNKMSLNHCINEILKNSPAASSSV